MLRNIPAIISPNLLACLAEMGHGDEIVICDANFPARSITNNYLRLDGASATETLAAILKLMPLDSYVKTPAITMQVVGDNSVIPEIVIAFQEIINQTADVPAEILSLERFAFYDRAKQAYAVIQTTEFRLYGNIILKKGVIAP